MTANTSVGAQPLYERIAELTARFSEGWHYVLMEQADIALLREAAEALRNAESRIAEAREAHAYLEATPHYRYCICVGCENARAAIAAALSTAKADD